LQVSVPQVSIQQQGTGTFFTVFLTRLQGFSGSVTIALQGLPTGVTATPTGPTTLVAGSSTTGVSFQLSASTAAAVGTTSITATGTSDSLTHSVNGSLTVLAQAHFHLSLSLSAVSLTPGSTAPVQVTLVTDPGASPTILLTTAPAPANSGVTVSIPPFGLTTAQPTLNVTVNAELIAEPVVNFPLTFIATDNTVSPPQTSLVTLDLNVSVPFPAISARPRSTFARTDTDPTDAVYDPVRKLVFATINGLNEVHVFSSLDASLKATIPVPWADGIDISADGSQIYVGSSATSHISIIDPNLLQVVRIVSGPARPPFGPGDVGLDFPRVLRTLATGKVLIIAQHSDTSEDHVFLWDPATDTFVQKDPAGILTLQGIVRSGDHTRALAFGNSFTFGSTAVTFYDPVSDTFNAPIDVDATKFVMNPNGTQIAAWSTTDITNILFFDGQLNQLASVPALSGTGVMEPIYSRDGSFLYVLTNYFNQARAVAVFNTASFTPVGISPDVSIGISFFEKPYDIDETGMIFRGDQSGLAFVDVSSPGTFTVPTFVLGSQLVNPELMSVSGSTSAILSGVFDPSIHHVFVGAPPASPASLQPTITGTDNLFTHITVPASGVPGPANLTITRSDGWYAIAPDAVTFGPHVLFSQVAGPPAGGSKSTLFGYGFSSASTQVSIGGSLASSVQATASSGAFPTPLNNMSFNSPAGAPGEADLTITTPQGSVTVPGGYQFLKQAQVFPVTGALNQIIYDQPRQRLYITNTSNNRVEIFSLGTNSFLAPIAVGANPTGIAQTPDGTLLAITNEGDGTVSVIDPDLAKVVSTFPVLVPADLDPACSPRAIALTPVKPKRMLVQVNCTQELFNGFERLLDLTTGSINCTGVVNCDPDNVTLRLLPGLLVFSSFPDAGKVLLAETGIAPSTIGVWDVDANQVTVRTRGAFPGEVTISPDTNLIALDGIILDAQLDILTIPQEPIYLFALAGSFNNNFGIKFNPSGSLFFFPQTNGTVDIFDVHRGRLALRVSLPEPSPVTLDPMVLDETGTRMFLISNSGLTIAQLSHAPLSIARMLPPSATAGSVVTIRGSGFESGATVSFGTVQVPAVLIDSNTLQATVPATSAGSQRITVTNPDGKQYAFDAAFTLN
jgi:IPT/TIG domain-containing protein